jgi:hypothetical protein
MWPMRESSEGLSPVVSFRQHTPGAPLYHGTPRDIEGDILPNAVHKKGRANEPTQQYSGDGRGDSIYRTPERLALDEHFRKNKAYATEHEDYAWTLAHKAANNSGGRGRVYVVGEQPDIENGAFNAEFVADKFPIKERIDIKPGHQGTLPIDWTPYGSKTYEGQALAAGIDFNSDVHWNHPSPERQEVTRNLLARKQESRHEWPQPNDWDYEEVPGQTALLGEDVPIRHPLSQQFKGLVPGGGV